MSEYDALNTDRSMNDSCIVIRESAKETYETDTLILIGIMGKGKSTLGNVIFMKEEDDTIPNEAKNPEL